MLPGTQAWWQEHPPHPTPLPKLCHRDTNVSDGNLETLCRSRESQGDGHWSSQGHTDTKSAPTCVFSPSTRIFYRHEEQAAVLSRVCSCPLHHCSELNPDGAMRAGIRWEAAMELAAQRIPRGPFVSFSTKEKKKKIKKL